MGFTALKKPLKRKFTAIFATALTQFVVSVALLKSAHAATGPQLSGSPQISVGQPSTYTFTPAAGAIKSTFRNALKVPYVWMEGAENGLSGLSFQVPLDATGSPIIINNMVYPGGGFHSFHLIQQNADDSWWLSGQLIVPQSGAILSFKSRLRAASSFQAARVQISTDNGLTWPPSNEVFSQAGNSSNPAGQSEFVDVGGLSLARFSGQNVRIRFVFGRIGTGAIYQGVSDAFGWFFDNVLIQTIGTPLLYEDAEKTAGNYTVTPGIESISSTVYPDSRPHSFHLAQGSAEDAWLELDRNLIPHTGSVLQFKSRLRAASSSQSGRVLVSLDGGFSWPLAIFNQTGNSSAPAGEAEFRDVAPISLDRFAGQSIRLRFVFGRTADGASYQGVSDQYGWFVDDIAVSNAEEMREAQVASNIVGSSVVFNPTKAGDYAIQLQPVGSDQVPMEWGPVKSVFVTSGNGNSPPSITAIEPKTIYEDSATPAIQFTIGDLETAPASLVVTALSSNIALVPIGNLLLSGSGANRTVTAKPASDESGTTAVTLTVSDGSLTATTVFVLTVQPVNDAPVAYDQTLAVIQDCPKQGALIAADKNGDPLSYSPVFSVLTPSTKGSVTLNSNTGVFTYTPTLTANGIDRFTFRIMDPAGNLVSNEAQVTVMIPALIAPAIAPTAEGCQLTWPSSAGKTYTIQRATDLRTWIPAATVTANLSPAVVTHWTDTASSVEHQMFYRVEVSAQ